MRGLSSIIAAATLLAAAAQAAAAPSPMDTIVFPVTTDSAPARAAFERGMVALHSFAYSDALEAFRAATAADPGFVDARRPAQARAAFAAALDRYPNRPRPLLGLARAARQVGDGAAAREACRQLASTWSWPNLAEVRSCAR